MRNSHIARVYTPQRSACGDIAHGCVHQSTFPSVLRRVFPKIDKQEDDYVILNLMETENITTVVDAVLGSDVGDGLIFRQ